MIAHRSHLTTTDTFATLQMDPLSMPQMTPPPVKCWFHSSPFDPLIEFDDAASPFQPDVDDYLIANIIYDTDAAGH
jgi:hypothetical protein